MLATFSGKIIETLYAAVGMFWMILWALILGFAISGMVQAFVSKKRMAAVLGKPGVREIASASFFGAVSSSCSYAASSMARNLFEKGAHIIPSLAFMLASTNLVLELSVILWVMMGWQFVLAEFVGGIVLVVVMSLLMRLFGPLEDFKKKQALLSRFAIPEKDSESGIARSWNTREGWARAAQGFTSEIKMIWKDIAIGVTVSALLMVFVPESFWQTLFMASSGHETQFTLAKSLQNAFVGPLVSMLSFVCSVGNIPLANVLFRSGISFGGAISFIYGDLIIIPLILVYRKYYGWKLALWITGIFYISMVIAGLLVDFLFTALDWIPNRDSITPMHHSMDFFQINYTFWLNIAFTAIAVILFVLAKQSDEAEIHDCCH
jgi:uncharacterized membrane protein YraQ (UPF0718 family)